MPRPVRPSAASATASAAAAKLEQEQKARFVLELSPTTVRNVRVAALQNGHKTTKAYVLALLSRDGVELAE